VKLDLNKKKNFHSLKVKKLIQKEKESFYELDKYIKEQYIPNITISQNYNSNPGYKASPLQSLGSSQ
jgi:hypothetical protein